jgi:hypothetical protein
MDQTPVVQVAAGMDPLYIARPLGHADAGFTLKTYGHLFETIKPTPVEWPEDLLWPSGYPWEDKAKPATGGDTDKIRSKAR